jgi:predicted methyltransferase
LIVESSLRSLTIADVQQYTRETNPAPRCCGPDEFTPFDARETETSMDRRTALNTLVGCLAFLLGSQSLLAAPATPKEIAAALSDPSRPDEDRKSDALRKPAELIAFSGIGPGSRVSELIPGQGYFTRIFSKIVGSKGKVYTLVPARPPNAPAQFPDFAAPINAIIASPGYSNIQIVMMSGATPAVDPVDVVFTSRNYHDVHNQPNANLASFNKRVFDVLKPGGLYIVIDHAAEAGSGARDTQTLHRIDPALVRSEVEAAGFKFVAESDVLHNPKDPHNVAVFDPSVRGHTDQFVYKFQKPR